MSRQTIQRGLDDRHWTAENHTQRMPYKQWRGILLEEADRIIIRGTIRYLIARKLGYGVVEVSKKPLAEDKDNG